MLNVMNLGGGTGNAAYKVVTINPSSVVSQNDTTFPYHFDVTWEAATETDFVDASIRSGEYDGSYQIESMSGKLRIRFTKKVENTLLMYVYIMTGEVSSDGTPGNAYYDKTAIDNIEWQGFDGAGFHNSIYRGKFLGNAVSDEYWTAIGNGTFRGLFIGDYWTIGDVNWRIAHFDYWLNTGSVGDICTKHHAVIVPDKDLYSGRMNATNTAEGAYAGSEMHNSNLTQARNMVNAAFGSSHILNHKELLNNAITGDYESGQTWYDSDVELMNEAMVYGTEFFRNFMNGTNFANNYTIDKTQLKLFSDRPDLITTRTWWWLRDVVMKQYFALVYNDGSARCLAAGNEYGVRPCFAIKAS